MRKIFIITVLAMLATRTSAAQENSPQPTRPSSFSVKGMVVDSEGSPLAGAEVHTAADERAISDASGEFVLSNLKDRSVTLFVRRLGYAPVSLAFDADPSVVVVSVRARLVPAGVTLGTVVVEGKTMDKDLWEKGFYDRMNGAMIGTFFTPERLAHNAVNVSTLISEVPRVQMIRGPGRVAVPMAPYKNGTEYCTLSAVIDGMPFSSSVVGQIGIDNLVNVREVKAIEVYLRAGRIPNVLAGRGGTQSTGAAMNSTPGALGGSSGGAFGGSDGVECGTIVVWTKPH